jgi:hypothetical protein
VPRAIDISRVQARVAGASNTEIHRLGAALFPGARDAGLRAAVLRLYAIAMTADEWAGFVLRGEPAAIVIDHSDAALLAAQARG